VAASSYSDRLQRASCCQLLLLLKKVDLQRHVLSHAVSTTITAIMGTTFPTRCYHEVGCRGHSSDQGVQQLGDSLVNGLLQPLVRAILGAQGSQGVIDERQFLQGGATRRWGDFAA
jgi:hypothetical protein